MSARGAASCACGGRGHCSFLCDAARASRSRLGCQIKLTKALDGMVVHCPETPPSNIP